MKMLNGRRNIIPVADDIVSRVSAEVFSDDVAKSCLRDIRDYDTYTYGHSLRVCSLAIRIGSIYFLDFERLVELGKAATLHDYGKILVDIETINKKGKLTFEEYEDVKKHVAGGAAMLRERGLSEEIVRYVSEHHERVDGSGYPNGLLSEAISLEGKVLAIADIFDAVTVKRVYNNSNTSVEDAMALLQSMDNVDYTVVEIFEQWSSTFRPVD
jgi:putative nucleotidyltransferase with HDIG domain